jgi:hypothetical protein
MADDGAPSGAARRGLRRLRQVLFGAIVMVAPASPTFPQDNAAALRGAEIADEWCRLCHLRPGDRPDPDMAPTFEELVKRPDRDRAFYRSFMVEDHFPMTTFRLYNDEKNDVVEYLLSLQNR